MADRDSVLPRMPNRVIRVKNLLIFILFLVDIPQIARWQKIQRQVNSFCFRKALSIAFASYLFAWSKD